MKRAIICAVASIALAAAVPASAEVARSYCSGSVAAGSSSTCTTLPLGPMYTVAATAAPGVSGEAWVEVALIDPVLNVAVAECRADASDGPASCSAKSIGAASGITPALFGQGDGNNLVLQCLATGSGVGTFHCEAATV